MNMVPGRSFTSALVMLLAIGGKATAQTDVCPTARNETNFVYAAPQRVAEVARLSTRLTPGAIIGTEVQAMNPVLKRTTQPIETTTPLVARFEAGTMFGRKYVEGAIRDCIFWGTNPFQPPVDEDGRPFPTICLEDSDSDGGFETMRFFAYRAAAGRGILETRISPVRFEPHQSIVDMESAHTLAFRRLRVVSIEGNRLRLDIEHALTAPAFRPTEPNFVTAPTAVDVELHEGTMTLAGLDFHVLHMGQSWTVTPAGDFRRWIGFDCEGMRVRLIDLPGEG